MGSRAGGSDSFSGERGKVFDGGRSRRPVVYTGSGVKVMIVGSGGGGEAFEGIGLVWLGPWEEIEPGEASFLCVRKRVVRACWRSETRVKGVVCGRWRCASLMVVC